MVVSEPDASPEDTMFTYSGVKILGKSFIACDRLRPSMSDWCRDCETARNFGCLRRLTSTPSDSSSVMPAPRRWASCSVKRYCWEWLRLVTLIGGAGGAAPALATAFEPCTASFPA